METWPTVVDDSGNVFVSGCTGAQLDSTTLGPFTIPNKNKYHMFIVTKADSSGSFRWAIGTQNTDAEPINMVLDRSGNIYVFGVYSNSSCSIGTFTLANPMLKVMYFLFKCSSNGQVIWAENIAGQDFSYVIETTFTGTTIGGVGIDGTDNIYIAGVFNVPTMTIGTTTLTNASTTGDTTDIFLAKFDSGGHFIWAKSFGGNNYEYCLALNVSQNGDVFISGSYSSSTMIIGTTTLTYSKPSTYLPFTYLAKFNSNGDALWAKNLTQHIVINGIKSSLFSSIYLIGTLDSSIILGDDTLTYNASAHSNVVITKFDFNGNVLWANSAGGGNEYDVGYGVDVDVFGNVWVNGGMGGLGVGSSTPYTMNFSGHMLTTPAGMSDAMFMAEYDTLGKYITCLALPTGGDDQTDIVVDNKGNFYVSGDMYNLQMVIGRDTVVNKDITSDEPMFIAKYRYFNCNLEETKPTVIPRQDIIIRPNPASTFLTITASDKITSVAINNLIGQTVYNNYYHNEEVQIDVSPLPAGMYLVRINGTEVTKFVKQ
jgi:hypothetical protein